MVLIAEYRKLSLGTQKLAGATAIRITLPKTSLSIPYELKEKSVVHAEVIKVLEDGSFGGQKQIPISPFKLDFILVSANVAFDSLYIDEKSWPLLRDYGILPDRSSLSIRFTSFEKDGTLYEIYPKRDVVI